MKDNILTNEYVYTGFFATGTMSAMMYQDLLIAVLLGFFGAFGGFCFKLLKDYITSKLTPKRKSRLP